MDGSEQRSRGMHVDRRGFLRAGLGALGVGLLAACAPAAPPAPTAKPQPAATSAPAADKPAAAPAATSAPAAAPAATPVSAKAPAVARGGELTIAVVEDWQSLNPQGQAIASADANLKHFYEPLVEHDDTGKVVPRLAESWKLIDDTTWEFQLRKGIKFHDGTEFTADSVKYTVERLINPENKSPVLQFFTTIDSVEVKDKYTALIKTKQPDAALTRVLTTFMLMLPPSAAQAGFFEKPVGTGPFKLVQYSRGDRLVLEANPDYWDQGLPKLQKLTFRFVPEESVRVAGLLAGDLQVVQRLPIDSLKLVESNPNLTVQKTISSEMHFLVMHNGKEPWTDARVRRALAHGIDRDKIVNDLLLGAGKPLQGVLPPTNPMAVTDLPPYAHDPAKAKALLDEAGFKGMSGEIVMIKGLLPKQEEIGQLIAAQVAPLGFKLSIAPLEGNAARERRAAGNFDLFFTWTSDFLHDPDPMLRFQMYGPSTRTTSRYSNPEVDKLIEAARSALDQAKRKELYAQAQRLIWEDSPLIFLYQPQLATGLSKRVQGYTLRTDWADSFRGVYLSG